jgi:hypothetical protein
MIRHPPRHEMLASFGNADSLVGKLGKAINGKSHPPRFRASFTKKRPGSYKT